MRIAILGGTGQQGPGLALRWARHEEIVIGSRQQEKADRVSGELNARLGENLIRGLVNRRAAEEADVVVMTVPYGAHKATLGDVREALKGKIFIDTTVPLDPERPTQIRSTSGGSAIEEAQEFLGPDTHVAGAFQTVSFTLLQDLDHPVEGDVLVCSDYKDAREMGMHLARLCGFRALDGGPARNARVVEGLTALFIHLNRRYKVKHAGFRVTGLEESERLAPPRERPEPSRPGA
ncbi:MAG: NADPH-dependent F420 reductase [Nitrospinota bacterium]